MKCILKPCENNVCGKSYSLLNVKLLKECPGKCEWCIASGARCGVPVDWKIIANQIIEMKDFQTVDLLGGEPSIYPHLYDITKAIRPYKKVVRLITNGYNMKAIESVVPLMDRITFSIHHYIPSLNKTGINVDFEALKHINKHRGKCETIMACVCERGGIDNINAMEKYIIRAAELGFSAVKFIELISTNEDNTFVDLQDLLKDYGVHQKNPTLYGCEFILPKTCNTILDNVATKNNIKVYIKLTCPFASINKAKVFGIPSNIEYQKNYMNVIHPDGVVTDKWVYEDYSNKVFHGEIGANYGN